jgi:ABC-type tungstate transport system substrate-binding protein
MMEPTMQIEARAEASVTEIRRMSRADYSAMKDKLVREAQIAQAAAIRAAFARLIAAIAAFAAGSRKGAIATMRSGN